MRIPIDSYSCLVIYSNPSWIIASPLARERYFKREGRQGGDCRRSAGRPERANDVKLSRGGIREIEFTVQLLQGSTVTATTTISQWSWQFLLSQFPLYERENTNKLTISHACKTFCRAIT